MQRNITYVHAAPSLVPRPSPNGRSRSFFKRPAAGAADATAAPAIHAAADEKAKADKAPVTRTTSIATAKCCFLTAEPQSNNELLDSEKKRRVIEDDEEPAAEV